MSHLKNKAKQAQSFNYSVPIKQREAIFTEKTGRKPITDSEIDEVYGPGEATRALDEVYIKRAIKKRDERR